MLTRRHLMMLPGAGLLMRRGFAQEKQAGTQSSTDVDQVLPDQLLLKNYRPKWISKIPETVIEKAKFPVIDMHCHARARKPEDVDEWIRVMDKAGVEKTIVFSNSGERFNQTFKLYSRYPKRFDVWCGLDMSDVEDPGFGPTAIRELERCRKIGAVGVGEVSDKGMGIGGRIGGPSNWQGTRPSWGGGSGPRNRPAVQGLHPDDSMMDKVWQRCSELGMPINLHMSDPYWSSLPQNRFNDGLMNGFSWRLDNKPGLMGHNDLLGSLERALERHRETVFVCCHLANLDYDLTRLGGMFERHPNMYADISARFCETAAIPRFTTQFLSKYPDRVCYGTDMPYTQEIFSTTFRVLESFDEHFYAQDLYFNFDYHWPMHGFGLPDDILKKLYLTNAQKAIEQARKHART